MRGGGAEGGKEGRWRVWVGESQGIALPHFDPPQSDLGPVTHPHPYTHTLTHTQLGVEIVSSKENGKPSLWGDTTVAVNYTTE